MKRDFQLMPDQASYIAGEIDALYMFLVWVSAVMTALIAALIIYFAIKYRRGSPADRQQGKHAFFAIELAWISPELLFVNTPLCLLTGETISHARESISWKPRASVWVVKTRSPAPGPTSAPSTFSARTR